ncbi:MAG: alpha-amylase family glycosyl hydrolase [Tepidisphaeraceae bacterium]
MNAGELNLEAFSIEALKLMSDEHRPIPVLPSRPRVHPIAGHIARSYPVGRQSFSRACQGEVLELTITTDSPLANNIQAILTTTLNSNDAKSWTQIPFERNGDRKFKCCISPAHPGLHSFRAEFSLDGGSSWFRDTVPDAWILIDPPQVDALRIYTLIPNVSGTLANWKADLKRINDMGFNAIHLLPITTMDKSQSPYSAKDLFEVDSGYLTKGSRQDGLSQLEEFITEAKRVGIRLVFDLVLNHVGVQSTMATQAPDWIVPNENEPDGLKRARYWCSQGWLNWNDLVLINYEHPTEVVRSEIWSYMIDYALFWAKYADDTGGFVRFDNLHSSDPDFVRALTTSLHNSYPEVGILAEYFADESILLRNGPEWGLNLNLATPWNCKFVPQLRDYLKYIHRVSEHIRYFMPITSHDCGAPAQEFGTADSTVPRYVAAALFGTGATGVPQGVELGEKERIDFIGRKPRMSFPDKPRFAQFIRRVNDILAKYPAFRRGVNCWFIDNDHPAIIAAFRRDNGPDAFGFLVACNFDTLKPQCITIELAPLFKRDGPFDCCELLSGERRTYPHPRFELSLPPSSAQVLKFPRDATAL